MSETKTRLPLSRAEQLANAIVAELAPGCERIEVAGSIRRRKPDVGDIEVVAIPKMGTDLLGDPVGSALDSILDAQVAAGRFERVKGGDRYRQFIVKKQGIKLDLFLTDADCWGAIFTIRTGSAEFSHKLVTPKSIGGLLPSHLRVQGGRLRDSDGKAISTPEETDLFNAIGLPWIEPEKR